MRRALVIAAAMTLATAPIALAQEHDHGGGGHPAGEAHPSGHGGSPAGGGGPPGGRPNPGLPGGVRGPGPVGDEVHGPNRPAFQGGAYPARPPGGFGGNAGQAYRGGGYQGGYRGRSYPGGQGFQGYQGGQGYRGGPGFQGGYNGPRGPSFNGPGFHGPGQFSYRGQRFASFRAAPFRYPQGWGYRRWGVGAILPGLFLADAYFIGDWGDYDLGPPPPGDHWVRYGPDALLVNNYTGHIDDVAYGVFYW